MECLLIDGMAQAWTMHLYWLGRRPASGSIDAIRAERAIRQRDAWVPPRLSEAEAVNCAGLLADRFQRQVLRLLKCYHDRRRLGVSMTVTDGQVNVAEQQINVTDGRASDAD